MTRRLFAVAVATLLGLASPALAFHPFHHSCGTTHHHTVAAPTTFHTVAPPVTFHTVAAPTFHTVAVPTTTFHTVAVPTTTFHTVAAPATTFHLVAADSSTTNFRTVAPDGNLKTTAGYSMADVQRDLQRIKEDLDAIRAKQLIPREEGRRTTAPADMPMSQRRQESEQDRAGLLALEREALARRSAAAAAPAAAPAPVAAPAPAQTARDRDLADLRALEREALARQAAAAAPTTPATATVRR